MIGTYLKPPLNNQLSVSKPIQAIEKRFLNQQGEYRWVLQHLRAIWSPSDGQATKLQCLVADLQDIHSQKLYETARLAERERLLMVEAMAHLGSGQMIFSTGQYWLSQECSRILGLNPNRIDPGPLMSLNFVHPQDREAIIHQVISLKQPATEPTAALQLSPFEDLEADFRIIWPNREIRLCYS